MDKVKIAILGLGNVGKGVWKILQKNENEIMKRSGCEIEVAKILVKDKSKSRDVEVPSGIITDDFQNILDDKDIKIVIELMGGAEPSKEYMLKSMKAKKHVVTANKLVLANWGEELFKTSQRENVQFYYEASVGGGIPIIREINESLTANRIKQITGILNGTTNYILSKMTIEGMSYEKALKEAQQKGYAEADPTSDVEGYDVAYKLAIISSLAFGTSVHPDLIFRVGISNIRKIDIDYAKKFGYKIKLLAIAKEKNQKLELRVHPALVPDSHPFANVNDSFNAVFIKGNAVGDLMLIGRGAGDLPTGSAVVGDVISILRNNEGMTASNVLNNRLGVKEIKKPEENESKFYVRLNVKDTVGVLGQISTVFGENDISIISVTQDINQGEDVSLVFITYNSMERNMKKSLALIEQLDSVNKVESIIRIENFN